MKLAAHIQDEIYRRHGDLLPRARRDIPELATGMIGIVCLERARFSLDHHYLVADGAAAEDRDLVYAVAMVQGLESVYADLRKSTVEDWCVVVASLS